MFRVEETLCRSLEIFLYTVLPFLILCSVNFSLLGLSTFLVPPLSSKKKKKKKLPVSSCMPFSWSSPYSFPISQDSLSLLLNVSCLLQLLLHYFVQKFSCFRQEDKYSPCYFILPTGESTNYSRRTHNTDYHKYSSHCNAFTIQNYKTHEEITHLELANTHKRQQA